MSNRKKLRGRRRKQKVTVHQEVPLQGELFRILDSVEAPEEDKEIIKRVPAMDGDVVVGETYIYDDGSFDIVLSPDAPEGSVEKIRELERELKFMDGEEPDGHP